MKGSYWHRYCVESCFPSLRFYAQSHTNFGKIFWLIITLFGFAFATLLTHCFMQAFIDSPTFISVQVEHINEGLELPQFVICFNYRFSRSKMAANGINNSLTAAYVFHTFYSPAYQEAFFSNNSDKISKLISVEWPRLEANLENPQYMMALMRNMTPSCEDLIFYCLFDLRFIADCCQFLQATVHIAPQGPCLMPNNKILQRSAGRSKGLAIGVRLPPLSELPPTPFYMNTIDGVEMFTSPEDAIVQKDSVFVPRGSAATMQLSMEVKKNVNHPRSPCFEPDKSQTQMSRTDCNSKCLLKSLEQLCGCIGVNTFLQDKNVSFCTPKMSQSCARVISNQLGQLTETVEVCNRGCLDLCVRTNYASRVSFSPGTRKGFKPEWAQMLEEGPDEDGIYNMIYMMIYYADMYKMCLVERYSENWQTIISKIGGSYGLWVGTMFVGIVHILAFITSAIHNILMPKS